MSIHSAVNILLIESDALLRNTIASMLELYGHGILHADDENQVADLIKSTRCDVLIYSFNPGRMPLSEVVLNVKKSQPHIKVIITNECDAALKYSVDYAIDAYIKKPFTVEELQGVINAVVPAAAD